MTTIATLFSGGEGVGVGARAAGLKHLWGIEYDDDIADVARLNGFNSITADVMTVDPATLDVPDVLHASPVCKRASNANQSAELNEDGTKEAPEDIVAGEKVAQFIDVMRPRVFTLENVYQYRNFKAFKIICAALDRNGYMWDFDNINSADFFVPQTRRRLILRAVRRALLPMLPAPERWVGWYEAIEDLIPTLPESKFAPWQLARLPEILQTTLVDQLNSSNNNGAGTHRTAKEPAISVTNYSGKHPVPRAFIVDCQKAGNPDIEDDKPSFTVRAGENGGSYPRALLVSGGNSFQPVLNGDAPSFTLGASPSTNLHHRAWLSRGRVVSITPRALARFQSIPDSYILPDSKKLACTVIGNMVPPLLYQKIIRQLTENS